MVTLPPELQGFLEWAVANPEQSVPVVAAFLMWLVGWKRTGKAPIGRLPWRYIRRTFRDLKYAYGDVPRPRGVPGIVTEATAEAIDETLREDHYFEGSPYGYYYDREVLTLRRPAGIETHPVTGDRVQMVLHTRAFGLSDGRTLWLTHREASRYEDQGAHLDESMLSWKDGQAGFSNALSGASIPHEHVASETEAGLSVVSPDKQGDGRLVRLLRRYIPAG